MAKNVQEGLMFRGRPLIRQDKTLYYGSMCDPQIVMLQELDTKEENGLIMGTKVSVTLMLTVKDLPPKERIIKKSEKSGLYDAMDLATAWLDRAASSK